MKRALVTGATSGIGRQTALRLAELGFEVCFGARNPLLALSLQQQLTQINPRGRHHWLQLDLSSFQSVRAFATAVGEFDFDLLVNNAGAKIESPRKLTEDGIEWHLGVNHFSHFLLTTMLLPQINEDGRVVTVSSIVARRGLPIDQALNLPEGLQRASTMYAASKLANLTFALALRKKLETSDLRISSIACHPGFTKANPYGPRMLASIETVFAQSARAGAEPLIAASTDSTGLEYLGPKVLELWGPPRSAKVNPLAISETQQQTLWELSEAKTGTKFEI